MLLDVGRRQSRATSLLWLACESSVRESARRPRRAARRWTAEAGTAGSRTWTGWPARRSAKAGATGWPALSYRLPQSINLSPASAGDFFPPASLSRRTTLASSDRLPQRCPLGTDAGYAPALNRRDGWSGRSWGGPSWQAGEKRILPMGRDPSRRSKPAQIHGGESRPLPAHRLAVLPAFIGEFDGAVNGFAPIAECALQLAGLHDPLFAPLQHDELDELGHLVKSAKQPNQKDDRKRDSDQP